MKRSHAVGLAILAIVIVIVLATMLFPIHNILRVPSQVRFLPQTVEYTMRMSCGHEPKTHERMSEIVAALPKGSVVIDAGCHIGDTTLRLQEALPPHGGTRIIAVDPNHTKLSFLRAMLDLNAISDVQVVQAALGAQESRVSEVKRGISSAWRVAEDANGTIPLTTIDRLVGTQRAGLLHLDVEGFELKALRGATTVLYRDHPDIMLEHRHGEDKAGIQQFLAAYGYTQTWAGEHNRLYQSRASMPTNVY